MAKLTIPDEVTVATFTVTTENDTFPIDFAVFTKADLRVRVGADAELDQADFTFDGTLLEGGGYQGGEVVLNTPISATTLRIWRDVRPQRSENFGAVTAVAIAAVDLALSRQMAVSQDIRRDQAVLEDVLPYLTDLPATIESVLDARDEAVAATASKADQVDLLALADVVDVQGLLLDGTAEDVAQALLESGAASDDAAQALLDSGDALTAASAAVTDAAAAAAAVAGKLPVDGVGADDAILTNIPYLAPETSAIARPVAEKLDEVLSVNDFEVTDPGSQFSFAQAAAGLKSRAINVPTGTHDLSFSLSDQNTWVIDGPITLTGAGAAAGLPGTVFQFSGVKNADGSSPDANPVYVGLSTRGFTTAYESTFPARGNNPLDVATLAVFSPYGFTGLFGGARSSDNARSGYDEGGIGVYGYCDNNRTSPQKGMYAFYADAIRRDGAGTVHVMEFENINYGDLVQVKPNSMFTDGITTGAWIFAGGAAASPLPSSVAIGIGNNGARWDRGIVFHDAGLVDRGSGTGEAIAFGYKHFLAGYNSSGDATSLIRFQATTQALGTTLVFDDSGLSATKTSNGANRFNVNDGGFVFGPSGTEWMGYNSGVFTVGPVSDPWIYATSSGISFPKAANLSRVGSGAYSLEVVPVSGAATGIRIQGAASGAAAISVVGSGRSPLLLLGNGAGLKIGSGTVYASDNATAAAAGCEINELYVNTANGALCPRTA